MANRFAAQTPVAIIVAGLTYPGIGESLPVVSYRSFEGWLLAFVVRRHHGHGGGAGTQPRGGAFAPGSLATSGQLFVRPSDPPKARQPRKYLRMDMDCQRSFL